MSKDDKELFNDDDDDDDSGSVSGSDEAEAQVDETPDGDAAQQPRRRKKRVASYQLYLYKVLKQLHPDLGISGGGMVVMNDIVDAFMEQLLRRVREIAIHNRGVRKTVSASTILSAVKLTLCAELSKHAVVEGQKAVGKYVATFA